MIGIKTPKKKDKKFSLDCLSSNNNPVIFNDLKRLSFGPENLNLKSKIDKVKTTDIKVNIFDYEKKNLKNDFNFFGNFNNKNNTNKNTNTNNKSETKKKKKFGSFFQNNMMDDLNSKEELQKLRMVNSSKNNEDEFEKKEFGKENNMTEINKLENFKQNKSLEISNLKKKNDKKMLGDVFDIYSSSISFKGITDTQYINDFDQNIKNEEVFEKQVNLDLKEKFDIFSNKEDIYSNLAEIDIISLIIKHGGVKIESEEELYTPELYRSGFNKKNKFFIENRDQSKDKKNLFKITDKEKIKNENDRKDTLEKKKQRKKKNIE